MENTNKWIITITVITATLVANINISSVNVALPYMRGNLGASVEEITWVVTGYMMANVLVMPVVALLSSRFGRKRLYLFCIILFTVSSMVCGIAWNLGSLIVFRIIQGLGGGALVPIAQAILRETFPREEQGTAMGIYGLGIILGPSLGPTLGGWITDSYSWRWVFYCNVPVGIIAFILASRFIYDPPFLHREKGKIDFLGLTFMIIGLGTLQIMLAEGERNDWFGSTYIIYLAVIASTGLSLFVIRELMTDKPAVDLRILKNFNFSAGTAVGAVLGMALFANLFILPLFLQQLLDFPAFNSGLTLLPRSVGMLITMPVAGRLFNKLGPKFLVGCGLVISAFSSWELSRMSLEVGYWDIFSPQLLQGAGFGMIFAALSTAALLTIERPKLTAATGLYNVVRQVFSSIGVALAATVLSRGENRYRAIIVENVNQFNDVTADWLRSLSEAMLRAGSDAHAAHWKALKLLDGEIMRQSAMLAYNHVFFLISMLFIISIPFVFLLKGFERDAQ